MIATPYLWLLVFFLVPFAIVLKISLADPLVAQPPFSDFFDWSGSTGRRVLATLDNYRFLLEDQLYLVSYLNSIKIALISTGLCLLLGFPMAYAIARSPYPWRNLLLLLVILPFWTSFLLRVYAWMVMLGKQGLINQLLISARPDRTAPANAVHRLGGIPGHRLHLRAVHDPATVRHPGETRPGPARGRRGSRRPSAPGISRHHPAAGHAGHHRRLLAGVHSRRWGNT